MHNKLHNFVDGFYKLSALEWGEKAQWVPEKFRSKKVFENFPNAKPEKVLKNYGLADFREKVDINIVAEDNPRVGLATFISVQLHNMTIGGVWQDLVMALVDQGMSTTDERGIFAINFLKITQQHISSNQSVIR